MLERMAKEREMYNISNPNAEATPCEINYHRKKGKRSRKGNSPTNNHAIAPDSSLLVNLRDADKRPSFDLRDLKSAGQYFEDAYDKVNARIEVFRALEDMEKNEISDDDSERMWNTMTGMFCQTYVEDLQGLTMSKYYYQLLANFVSEYSLETCMNMKRTGVFEKAHPPSSEPMIICSLQGGITDFLPRRQFLVPLQPMMDAGFAPPNTLTFNPFDKPFICAVIFWSIYHKMTMFGCIYDGNKGLVYHWVYYDRKTEDISSILRNRPHHADTANRDNAV